MIQSTVAGVSFPQGKVSHRKGAPSELGLWTGIVKQQDVESLQGVQLWHVEPHTPAKHWDGFWLSHS